MARKTSAVTINEIAQKVASEALQSAYENGAAVDQAEQEAADRIDGAGYLGDIAGCGEIVAGLSDADLRTVARRAVELLTS